MKKYEYKYKCDQSWSKKKKGTKQIGTLLGYLTFTVTWLLIPSSNITYADLMTLPPTLSGILSTQWKSHIEITCKFSQTSVTTPGIDRTPSLNQAADATRGKWSFI